MPRPPAFRCRTPWTLACAAVVPLTWVTAELATALGEARGLPLELHPASHAVVAALAFACISFHSSRDDCPAERRWRKQYGIGLLQLARCLAPEGSLGDRAKSRLAALRRNAGRLSRRGFDPAFVEAWICLSSAFAALLVFTPLLRRLAQAMSAIAPVRRDA